MTAFLGRRGRKLNDHPYSPFSAMVSRRSGLSERDPSVEQNLGERFAPRAGQSTELGAAFLSERGIRGRRQLVGPVLDLLAGRGAPIGEGEIVAVRQPTPRAHGVGGGVPVLVGPAAGGAQELRRHIAPCGVG